MCFRKVINLLAAPTTRNPLNPLKRQRARRICVEYLQILIRRSLHGKSRMMVTQIKGWEAEKRENLNFLTQK